MQSDRAPAGLMGKIIAMPGKFQGKPGTFPAKVLPPALRIIGMEALRTFFPVAARARYFASRNTLCHCLCRFCAGRSRSRGACIRNGEPLLWSDGGCALRIFKPTIAADFSRYNDDSVQYKVYHFTILEEKWLKTACAETGVHVGQALPVQHSYRRGM